jgi:hypothetical protein
MAAFSDAKGNDVAARGKQERERHEITESRDTSHVVSLGVRFNHPSVTQKNIDKKVGKPCVNIEKKSGKT